MKVKSSAHNGFEVDATFTEPEGQEAIVVVVPLIENGSDFFYSVK